MSEKLYIKNFAGIKEMELDMGEINILIGPQASGKSVCAKLLYFFRGISSILAYQVIFTDAELPLDVPCINELKKYFYIPKNPGLFELKYTNNRGEFIINHSEDGFDIHFEGIFENVLNYIKETSANDFKLDTSELDEPLKNFFLVSMAQKKISDILGTPINFKQVFIPSGRSYFTTLHSNIFSFLNADNDAKNRLDPFILSFGSSLESAKSSFSKQDDNILDQLKCSFIDIIGANYHHISKTDFIETNDGRLIDMLYSSSGQQEIIPLLLTLLKEHTSDSIGINGISFYVEEPETHLFPTTQKSVVEFMASAKNISKKPIQYFITTHSPYILSAFNNLIAAGNLKEELIKKDDQARLEKLYKVIDKEKYLKYDQFRAYSLENGTAKSIMEPDHRIIDANMIDDVSDEISREFGELLDIEFDDKGEE